MNENLALNLTATARTHGDRPALRADAATVSYAELDDGSARIARVLRDRGVEPGDRVGIMLTRCPRLPSAAATTPRSFSTDSILRVQVASPRSTACRTLPEVVLGSSSVQPTIRAGNAGARQSLVTDGTARSPGEVRTRAAWPVVGSRSEKRGGYSPARRSQRLWSTVCTTSWSHRWTSRATPATEPARRRRRRHVLRMRRRRERTTRKVEGQRAVARVGSRERKAAFRGWSGMTSSLRGFGAPVGLAADRVDPSYCRSATSSASATWNLGRRSRATRCQRRYSSTPFDAELATESAALPTSEGRLGLPDVVRVEPHVPELERGCDPRRAIDVSRPH